MSHYITLEAVGAGVQETLMESEDNAVEAHGYASGQQFCN